MGRGSHPHWRNGVGYEEDSQERWPRSSTSNRARRRVKTKKKKNSEPPPRGGRPPGPPPHKRGGPENDLVAPPPPLQLTTPALHPGPRTISIPCAWMPKCARTVMLRRTVGGRRLWAGVEWRAAAEPHQCIGWLGVIAENWRRPRAWMPPRRRFLCIQQCWRRGGGGDGGEVSS
jgi:hypothetical protein